MKTFLVLLLTSVAIFAAATLPSVQPVHQVEAEQFTADYTQEIKDGPDTTKFRSFAVTNAAVAVKASAGTLHAWAITNLHSAAIFVKFYNTAQGSTVVGTTAPVYVIQVPANDQVLERFPNFPVAFGTAITVTVVTGGADASAVAAATLPIIELEYQ